MRPVKNRIQLFGREGNGIGGAFALSFAGASDGGFRHKMRRHTDLEREVLM
jgi:hypothetical protein